VQTKLDKTLFFLELLSAIYDCIHTFSHIYVNKDWVTNWFYNLKILLLFTVGHKLSSVKLTVLWGLFQVLFLKIRVHFERRSLENRRDRWEIKRESPHKKVVVACGAIRDKINLEISRKPSKGTTLISFQSSNLITPFFFPTPLMHLKFDTLLIA
jgi:hypothetical protein